MMDDDTFLLQHAEQGHSNPSGADNDIAVLIRVWKAIGTIRGWVKLKIKTLLFPLCLLITRHYNDKD
jgi:hypothetical protein